MLPSSSRSRKDSCAPALVHVALAKPFFVCAESLGVPMSRYLRRHRLPEQALDEYRDVLPHQRLTDFINDIARSEGIPNFGHVALRQLKRARKRWQFSRPHGANLFAELNRMVEHARSETTAELGLRESGETLLFYRACSRAVRDDSVHSGWFALEAFMEAVRNYAGRDWNPRRIGVPGAFVADPCIRNIMPGTKFIATGNYWWFEVERKYLWLGPELADTVADGADGSGHEAVETLVDESITEGLSRMLKTYMTDGLLSLEEASEVICVKPRTLQRRLAAEDISFSQIADRTRLDRARELLEQTDGKMIDISLEVGYGSPASFTRAFRRYYGTSPLRHRQYHGRMM